MDGLLGWPASHMLVLHLPRSSQGVCVHLFCMSVLYFTVKNFLVMNPLGVRITYSVSGIWLLGVF